MQRIVTETVRVVQAALIDGIFPIDVEKLLGQGGDAIDIVGVERDDPCAEDIGDVAQRMVFVAFERQLAGKTLPGFDPCADSRHRQPVVVYDILQRDFHDTFQPPVYRQQRIVLRQNHFVVDVHRYWISKMLMKPVIMKT